MPLLLQRALREPTLHFLLLAGLLFLVYGLRSREAADTLQIDWQEVQARMVMEELNRGAPLSAEERRQLEQTVLDDHILVLEAKAQGLDNDPRINDMLAQKMRHVLSGEISQPSVDELQAYYQNNRNTYAVPASVTVEELVFSSREPLPESVQTQLQGGTPLADIATESPSSKGVLPRVTQRDLASIFDDEFAFLAFYAPAGTWAGPFLSNRGQHWLRVTEQHPATVHPFEQIQDLVRMDWITAKEDERLRLELDRLAEKYAISFINRTTP
ncbi:MAG: hypothetical protein RLZZ385_2075 [Pseudomonadota bacterium]|jgi:hypothetical protein